MPRRIQRKRAKGWRMPESAIYVGRGSIWGNPFVVGQPCGVFSEGMGHQGKAEILIESLLLAQVIEFYRNLIEGYVCPEMYPYGHRWGETFRRRFTGHPSSIARIMLGGHDLACWCPLDKPCHADVLLEIANRA